jgi:hypothetical protein
MKEKSEVLFRRWVVYLPHCVVALFPFFFLHIPNLASFLYTRKTEKKAPIFECASLTTSRGEKLFLQYPLQRPCLGGIAARYVDNTALPLKTPAQNTPRMK